MPPPSIPSSFACALLSIPRSLAYIGLRRVPMLRAYFDGGIAYNRGVSQTREHHHAAYIEDRSVIGPCSGIGQRNGAGCRALTWPCPREGCSATGRTPPWAPRL